MVRGAWPLITKARHMTSLTCLVFQVSVRGTWHTNEQNICGGIPSCILQGTLSSPYRSSKACHGTSKNLVYLAGSSQLRHSCFNHTHTQTHTHTCAQHLRNHGHVHRIVGSEPPNRYNNKIIPISLMILSSKVIFAYHDPATNSRGENLWKPRYIINQMQTYLTLSHQSYHYIMLYTWFKPITCSDIIQKPRDKVQFWRHRYQQPSDKLRSALPLMLPTMCWHEFPVKDLGFYIV